MIATCESCGWFRTDTEYGPHGQRLPKPTCGMSVTDPISGKQAQSLDPYMARLSPFLCGWRGLWWKAKDGETLGG